MWYRCRRWCWLVKGQIRRATPYVAKPAIIGASVAARNVGRTLAAAYITRRSLVVGDVLDFGVLV